MPSEVRGKRILDIGSLDHDNGTVRPVYDAWQPQEYIGVDVAPGPGVDMVLDVSQLLERFGPNCFDAVVTTETFEHFREWRVALHNIKGVLKPGGLLIATTRSRGFPFHYFPGDYWRFQPDDFREILSDMTIEALQSDPLEPGVFVRARKPDGFVERDLGDYELYNILAGRPTCVVEDRHLRSLRYYSLVALLATKTWLKDLRNTFRAKEYADLRIRSNRNVFGLTERLP